MAKELHRPDNDSDHTVESDMWSFGMVVCELLTRNIPYSYITPEARIPQEVLEGKLPLQPDLGI